MLATYYWCRGVGNRKVSLLFAQAASWNWWMIERTVETHTPQYLVVDFNRDVVDVCVPSAYDRSLEFQWESGNQVTEEVHCLRSYRL
jgi:hypothetical protein